jgi:hypothetical protein
MTNTLPKSKKYNLNDFHILYINLDRRPDRRKNVERELKRMGLKGTRIAGIDGQQFSEEEKEFWMDRKNFNTLARIPERVFGRAGCYLSHLRALKYAIDNSLYPVLILEDDISFLTNNKNIEIEIPRECDIFYLGGLYWWKDNPDDFTFENIRNKLHYDPYLQIVPKYFRIACTLAYIIQTRQDLINIFESMINKTKKAIDMMYVSHIQKYDSSYILQPSLVVQTDKFTSDITDYGGKPPRNPSGNTYFYNDIIYTNNKIIEFYDNNYNKLLPALKKYFKHGRVIPDPNKLFKQLRILNKKNNH